MQRQSHRILQTTRYDAVEQQLLPGIDHSKTVDSYPGSICRNTVRIDIPSLLSPADVRRRQPQIDLPARRTSSPGKFRTESDPSGNIADSIREIGNQLQLVILGPSAHSDTAHVKTVQIKILGRSRENERVAPVMGIQIQTCHQHPAPLDVIRGRFERKFVVRRVDPQQQPRSVRDL